MLNKVMCNLGIILLCLGICSADSECLLFPISLVGIGFIIIKLFFNKAYKD